jgi:sugar lactone lactonase YvrE
VPRLLETVEAVMTPSCQLAEGPVWDDHEGVLWWLDIVGQRLHAWSPDSGEHTVELDRQVSALGLTAGAGFVAATQDGFGTVDPATGAVATLAPLDGPVAMRMNDGKVDPAGRFWAGWMGAAAEPGVGAVYRFDGIVAEPVVPGVTLPNGIGWSPDGSTMYFVDSKSHRLDAFEFAMATGAVGERRTVAAVPAPVLPDGLTVDAGGGIWVALWDGGAVHRYTPSGLLDVVVRLPAGQVTSCAFGGPGLDELYITAATEGLFRCRPGFVGLPADRFAALS